ncbi:hypothetical protein L210DRAFT_3554096 [Boletus edulis BED1]|uniref:Uncharacterized protein n=1 Tax=Boletus edulis BED1 TaxID=1328754 RepID=A0AAD4GAR8_BOLED|nr:hypothetical protein L210DRAFT_3554096 [Boletus edulis BED1]
MDSLIIMSCNHTRATSAPRDPSNLSASAPDLRKHPTTAPILSSHSTPSLRVLNVDCRYMR